MQSEPMATETTNWFSTDTECTGPSLPTQYTLTASYSIEPDYPPALAVVEAVVDVTEPADGQASLELYEHVDPDALNDIISESSNKRSNVEVRFAIETYLVVVRSTDHILIYEPLDAH
ncbi:HalOD1 output domain-containing protein [Haladaptatus halobius]|uniref:HalOD1 output domain-containing protein n=1 Tax=Haladaptatus halobius TaxID=2884875 RepID=UPI001D0A948C|nr:HalOD1 output domain-containing protein [Haladaptatus halobius]